jgi:hypothetical protein
VEWRGTSSEARLTPDNRVSMDVRDSGNGEPKREHRGRKYPEDHDARKKAKEHRVRKTLRAKLAQQGLAVDMTVGKDERGRTAS